MSAENKGVSDYGGFAPRAGAKAPARRRQLSVDEYVDGVLAGDRTIMGRAITLVESRNAEHRKLAQQILVKLLPHAGKAARVGITGVPGVGKSTFIEAMGKHLTGRDHKVAVLAVDPTSSRTGGSILGDKTRMNELAVDPNAFIRPSPSSGTLGGVTRTTRETMVIVEAAGYDVVLVETVGVGQSETMVSEMVDFFLVLMLPGAGDELQGIKKGVLEIADMIAVNKADADEKKARLAAREYRTALHIMTPASPNWTPPVLTCSALAGKGLAELWEKVDEHRTKLTESGELPARRRDQQLKWMWQMVRDQLMDALVEHPEVKHQLPEIEHAVAEGGLTPALATQQILQAFGVKFDV
ncbi:putative periplasmic protein kinase ArgK [Caenispirillum salinarum AK4]|uniref:Putative periplasmic protein kinase ArgK n=1 Tax=Caenispirillum salinarum AK4 TaxID=1238182 RepID=K9HGL5_9PROT|nr:methylmalonyl Co-A mutase-associated GTPase MeaB [Caenispirillum salinarum]EKV29588.1 putative periplasmic protein kinase ArgK [Caenispirillum salinarum AK4]